MVLEGRGSGAKAVLARATLLLEEERTGRLTFAEEVLSAAARQVKRNDEPLEIALIARDAQDALLLRLPAGLMLAAVVAEEVYLPPPRTREELGRTAIPLLSGVANALEMVPEGAWVIVDPIRSRALIEPGIEEIARVQEQEGQRPRLLIGSLNTPAQTQSGMIIPIWAAVLDDDFEGAVAAGADGLLLTDSDGDVSLSRLRQAAEAVGGGDVVLYSAFEAVEIADLLIAASQCKLHWLLTPTDLPLPIDELRAELTAQVEAEQIADRPAALPLLSAALYPDSDPNCSKGYEEAVLIGYGVVNTLGLPPLRVYLHQFESETDLSEMIESAVLVGACGIIVLPAHIETAKNIVRELP